MKKETAKFHFWLEITGRVNPIDFVDNIFQTKELNYIFDNYVAKSR